MRTISKTLQKRLIAQADEANFQGLEKISDHLQKIASIQAVRSDNEEYVYSAEDLKNDVERLLWGCVVRTQDYFDKTADAKNIGSIITSLAEEIITSVRIDIGGDVIGPHEPFVPGEQRMIVEIDE